MPQPHPLSSDAGNNFEDLSGINTAAFNNPYDALIEACEDDPKQIQARYSTHRTARNAQYKSTLLAADFSGLNLDSILQRLEDPSIEPGFIDPRHSLVLWARPPAHIQDIISQIQQRMKKLAPNFWLMPITNLHMTALEITHSVTAAEVAALIIKLESQTQEMTDLPYKHRPRLVKPLLSFDCSALALSFIPAAGETLPALPEPIFAGQDPETTPPSSSTPQHVQSAVDAKYTYHHLRRDLYAITHTASVTIESRYVVPSAHITIGRFIVQSDHDSLQKRKRWIEEIESINSWLQGNFWPQENGETAEALQVQENLEIGQWIIGEGKGLDLRKGVLWYGGGETVKLGKGF